MHKKELQLRLVLGLMLCCAVLVWRTLDVLYSAQTQEFLNSSDTSCGPSDTMTFGKPYAANQRRSLSHNCDDVAVDIGITSAHFDII